MMKNPRATWKQVAAAIKAKGGSFFYLGYHSQTGARCLRENNGGLMTTKAYYALWLVENET